MAIPEPSSKLVDDQGRLTPTWADFFSKLVRSQTSFSNDTAALTTEKAAAYQPWANALLIEFPEDKDYTFIGLAIEGTIEEVITQTASGSCTVTVKINDQPLGGDANDANTTKVSKTHTAKNELTTDDNIVITVSNNSTAENCSVTLRGSMELV